MVQDGDMGKSITRPVVYREIYRTMSETLVNAPNPLNPVFLDHEFPASVKRVHDRASLEHCEVLYGCTVE